MLIKYIIKVFLYLILAVMTFRWLLKIPMILGNILLYFLSITFILTGVLSYGFALESARECGRMIIIGMAFGAIPDFVPFWGKSLETLVAKLLSMTNECESRYERGLGKALFSFLQLWNGKIITLYTVYIK